MPKLPLPNHNERGIALVMALLVLLVMSLLAATLMMSLSVDTKIASLSTRQIQALNIAEAGVAEAVSLIRSGDIPTNTNARQVAQIFNTIPGSVPVLGVDSVALATRQPGGQWLAYSTTGRSDNRLTDSTLTVTYKTNNARTAIFKYDPTLNPAVQLNTGYPIFVISSTGRVGTAYRRIVTEVIQKPFLSNVKAAFAADVNIQFSGTSDVCGYNHSMDTPVNTMIPACNGYHLASGHLPGSWSSKNISSGGASVQDGWPMDNNPNQVGFYAGPWEAMGMSQSEYFSWVGAPYSTAPANPKGIYYLDNNTATQDQSGAFAYPGGNGEGLLYVDGDLSINGNFSYKGLLYVEGDLKINGNAWILGGIIVRGKTQVKIANGTCTILYSADAISQTISRYGGQFVTLAWRESSFQ